MTWMSPILGLPSAVLATRPAILILFVWAHFGLASVVGINRDELLNYNASTTAARYANTIPPAPTARAALTTIQPEEPCAYSWWSWRNASASSSRSSESADRARLTMNMSYPVSSYSWERSSQVILYSTRTYTECDGIPRYSLNITGYSTTTESGINTYSEIPYSHYIDTHSLPTCSLSGAACYDNWKKLSDLGGKTSNWDLAAVLPRNSSSDDFQSDFFGCKPPDDICDAAFGGCAIYAQAIALVYFQPRLKRRDLCGNDGHGIFETESDVVEGDSPQTFITTALTVDRRLSYGEIKSVVITGQWTFTSPTVYMAYAGVNAEQRCRTVGSTYSGVMPMPLSELKTISYKPWEDPPKEVWNGSDLQFAQSMAAGLISAGFHGYDELPVPINILDLQEPIPAVNYFEQLGDCRIMRGNCSAIVEGDYFPQFVPPSRLWGLDSAWSTCTVSDGRWLWDPAIELSPTRRHTKATPPAWAKTHQNTLTAMRTPTETAVPAAPGITVIAALPMATGGGSQPGAVTDSSGSHQRIASELPEWRGPAIAPTATKVFAMPVAGNPGVIAIGSNLFVDSGPGYVLSSQTISLGQNRLVVGTRTLSIEYATTSANLRDLFASRVVAGSGLQAQMGSKGSPGMPGESTQDNPNPGGGGDSMQDQSVDNNGFETPTAASLPGQTYIAMTSGGATSTRKTSGDDRRLILPLIYRLICKFWG